MTQRDAYLNEADRKSEEHDLVCQYLFENINVFLATINAQDFQVATKELERPVCSSNGNIKGYIDLFLESIQQQVTGYYEDNRCWVTQHVFQIGVEVKTRPVGVGEVLRQIKLYKKSSQKYKKIFNNGENGFLKIFQAWILVGLYPLNTGEEDLLKTEGITFVQLGEKYREWKQNRKSEKSKLVL